jgi:hypothetical protein
VGPPGRHVCRSRGSNRSNELSPRQGWPHEKGERLLLLTLRGRRREVRQLSGSGEDEEPVGWGRATDLELELELLQVRDGGD